MHSMRRKPLFPGHNVYHQLDLITDLLGKPTDEEIAKVHGPPCCYAVSCPLRHPLHPPSSTIAAGAAQLFDARVLQLLSCIGALRQSAGVPFVATVQTTTGPSASVPWCVMTLVLLYYATKCYNMLRCPILCYPVVLFSAGTRLLNLPTGLTVSTVGEIRRRSPCAGPSRPDADLRPGVHACAPQCPLVWCKHASPRFCSHCSGNSSLSREAEVDRPGLCSVPVRSALN